MLYSVPQDKIQFNKIAKMEDSHVKFLKFCNYRFKVLPQSYFWNKAKEECERLESLGYGF